MGSLGPPGLSIADLLTGMVPKPAARSVAAGLGTSSGPGPLASPHQDVTFWEGPHHKDPEALTIHWRYATKPGAGLLGEKLGQADLRGLSEPG